MFYGLFLMIRRPLRATRTDTLFPDTTLFRAGSHACKGSVKLYAVVTPFERKSSAPGRVDQYMSCGVKCAVVPSIESHHPYSVSLTPSPRRPLVNRWECDETKPGATKAPATSSTSSAVTVGSPSPDRKSTRLNSSH